MKALLEWQPMRHRLWCEYVRCETRVQPVNQESIAQWSQSVAEDYDTGSDDEARGSDDEQSLG